MARALFYVAAVYADLVDLVWLEPQRETLLAWHAADPPSAENAARSERVAQFQTGCAAGPCVNPFVADPSLAERAFAPRPTATDTAPDESVITLSRPRPNPSAGPVWFTLSLPRPAHVRVVVLDALGREVDVVFDSAAPLTSDLHVETANLRPGLYVLRADSESESRSRLFVVVR